MTAGSPEHVRFYFDVMCPWAYQASLWIREVRDAGAVEVEWRCFSLEEVNREPGKPHPWERPWSYGWSLLRVASLLRRRDPAQCDRWYLAAGRALHEDGRAVFLPEGAAALARETGLGEDVVAAAIDDPSTHEDVRADHEGLVRDHGGHGVPTLVFEGGHALFGPVVVPAPRGREALRLWDLVSGWREFPTLYELRKPKTGDDLAFIAEQFSTYLAARRWKTVQKPAL